MVLAASGNKSPSFCFFLLYKAAPLALMGLARNAHRFLWVRVLAERDPRSPILSLDFP